MEVQIKVDAKTSSKTHPNDWPLTAFQIHQRSWSRDTSWCLRCLSGYSLVSPLRKTTKREGAQDQTNRLCLWCVDVNEKPWLVTNLYWWVQQRFWWTWCQTGPVSWWPHSHFLCLPKSLSGPPLPSQGPCTPSRCVLLQNKSHMSWWWWCALIPHYFTSIPGSSTLFWE